LGDVTTAILSEEYLGRKLPNSAGGLDAVQCRKANVKELFGTAGQLVVRRRRSALSTSKTDRFRYQLTQLKLPGPRELRVGVFWGAGEHF
jgi:hypothetical protein